MEIEEVQQKIINSFSINSSSNFCTSSPRIISLLDLSKKQKADAVKQAFFDFLRGDEIVILLSTSISSQLFKYCLNIVPQIWFIEGKVRVTAENKRKDVIALLFTHQKVTI